jgi:hypothetical protein
MGWLAELMAWKCAAAGRRDELSRWPTDMTWSRGDLRDQLMAVGGWCTVCCQHDSLVNCFSVQDGRGVGPDDEEYTIFLSPV